MYEEYKTAYAQHSLNYGEHTAIFYLVGKFYEMYDWVDALSGQTQTSMTKLVDILGIQMSVRKGDGPKGADGLFAGVPEQSLHKYAALLTRQSWTVIIYDQVKDAKGAVKERKVSRILTPGTHLEAVTQDACYIGGVWLEDAQWGSSTSAPTFGLAAVDLSTGRIFSYEGAARGKQAAWSADDAVHFFQVYSPKECTIWWKGDQVACPPVETLRRQFGLQCKTFVEQGSKEAQGGLEVAQIREEFLSRAIQIQTLLPIREAIGISKSPLTERILCATLQRLEELFPSGTQKFYSPARWSPSSCLLLGNQALVQLNMITPQEDDSVLGLFLGTQTPFGRRAMRNRLLYPKAAKTDLHKCYAEIGVFDELADLGTLQQRLKQIGDLPRIHRRLINADVTPADVLTLDQTYVRARQIASSLEGTVLSYKGKSIADIHKAFTDIFSVEKALKVTKVADTAFCFQRGKAPEVDRLEDELERLSASMKTTLKTITDWIGLGQDALRLDFKETLSPTISGPKASLTALKRAMDAKDHPFKKMELVTRKSSSHLEVQEIETTWFAIQRRKVDLQEAVRKAIVPLCDELAKGLHNWDELETWLGLVDVSYTLWKCAKDYGFVKPLVLDEGASLHIEGLRHPLIERRGRQEYVKHQVKLCAAESGWLVYGMNASGKSSLMKAVGIAVILAQAGSYVPATSFRFAPFRQLFTRILNTDNLWAGLSSFAVEMTELREILVRANSNTLVLGDELCSGTESISATALVGASLKHLQKTGAKFIFATHFHGLLTIPSVVGSSSLKVWHLKVRYDPVTDVLVYERTLTEGAGSSLYGLEVARAMNLPEEILTEAREIRRSLLGTASVLTAPKSEWNTQVQRRVCEICSAEIVNDLEVHHIQHRADSISSRNSDGTHMNDIRNLIVVCSKCHDKIHDSSISVGPMVQTSEGLKRTIVESVASSDRLSSKAKYTEEERATIENYLRSYPAATPKRTIFDLEQQGIHITTTTLRTIRKTA
jgi:DNA mismatch repair protein MutS